MCTDQFGWGFNNYKTPPVLKYILDQTTPELLNYPEQCTKIFVKEDIYEGLKIKI
jgi:hypothetical protein